jgi:hypothetical protein
MSDRYRRRQEMILVASIASLYLVPQAFIQWRVGDEGSIVYGAIRLLGGELPYRDFFEVMGPGSFLWLSAWFSVLGETWLALRLAMMVVWIGSVMLLYWLTLQVHDGAWRLIPSMTYVCVAVPIWLAASQHWDSNAAAFLALMSYVSSRHSVSRSRWIGCGLLVGVVGLFSQQKGTCLLISLILSETLHGYLSGKWRARLRNAQSISLGAIFVGAAWVGTYASVGALNDWFYAVVRWPLEQYGPTNRLPYGYGLFEWLVPSWMSILRALPLGPLSRVLAALMVLALVVVLLVPLAAPITAGLIVRRRDDHDRFALLGTLSIAGFGLFIAEAHRPDVVHLLYGTPLLLVVAVALSTYVRHRTASIAVGVFGCMFAAGVSLIGLVNLARSPIAVVTVHSRRGDYRAVRRDEALEFLESNLSPGQTAFIYPYYPMYYFLANLRNPTRYSTLMYGINTEAQFRQAIDAIEADRTRFVLWDDSVSGQRLTTWFPNYRLPDLQQQQMERYLESRYSIIGVKGGFRILERKPD